MNPKPDSPTCWRPNAIQLRSVKSSNAASYVAAKLLQESPAMECVAWFAAVTFSWFGVT